jgi:tRNA (guanine6-N2)-methyltransferase
VHGLEWLCADEISDHWPEAGHLELFRREVTFHLPDCDPALTSLRIADDVFLEVGRVGGAGTARNVPPALARELARLPWARRLDDVAAIRALPAEPLFDVVASIEGRRAYNRFAVEAALGSQLAPLLAGRYLRRTAAGREPGEPDLTIRIFVRGPAVIAALRLAAAPLHRRAYKLATGPGTLHAPVAAALARLAHPVLGRRGATALDPFCGDGTIAIEVALAHPTARVAASDVDPGRLANTETNAGRAGVRLAVSQADAGALGEPPGEPGDAVDAVVTNPPWNLAVDASGTLTGSLEPFWRRVPGLLTAGGCLVTLTDVDLSAAQALRRLGFGVGLASRIRVAGHVSEVVLAAPPGRPQPLLPESAQRWRERAISAGIVTASGF